MVWIRLGFGGSAMVTGRRGESAEGEEEEGKEAQGREMRHGETRERERCVKHGPRRFCNFGVFL